MRAWPSVTCPGSNHAPRLIAAAVARRALAGLLTAWIVAAAMTAQADDGPVTLVVFDIGSGTTRMLVAEVDPRAGLVLDTRLTLSRKVGYADDLARNGGGRFSEAIMAEGSAAMAELLSLAEPYQPSVRIGVATQAFREADNALGLVDRWFDEHLLDVRIISQCEEGRLAFDLVRAARPEFDGPLLVWDIGAASQQLIWSFDPATPPRINSSPLASVSFKHAALVDLERSTNQYSPNPISADEAGRLAELAERLARHDRLDTIATLMSEQAAVVGVGGVLAISVAQQVADGGGRVITRAAVEAALARQLGRSDQDIGGEFAATEVSNLILVAALMRFYGIERYEPMRVSLAEALLQDWMLRRQRLAAGY